MKNSRLSIVLASLVAGVLLFTYIGQARKLSAQDPEKSLDVKRYPNEPLELVDLKISQSSVKNEIRFKSKESISQWGLDNVKFRDKDDWFKRVRARLRNVSGRPIYGLSVSLYFKHSGLRMLFPLRLTPTQPRDLKQQPLQPGDEIDLDVTEASSNRTMVMMSQRGVDPNGLPASLSVDGAIFGDGLEWSRGTFLRRDPNNPSKWDAVDMPAPPGASRLKQPAGFTLISFKISPPCKISSYSPTDYTQCQESKAGTLATRCGVTTAGGK